MKQNDLIILSHLRKDARKSMVELSKQTGIPASTIYDRVNAHEKNSIKKYTALLDFEKLGFNGRIYVALRSEGLKDRENLFIFLKNHKCVNSLYKVNFGFHYLFEAIFRNIGEAESFLQELQEKFQLTEKRVFSVVEEVKKEEFLMES